MAAAAAARSSAAGQARPCPRESARAPTKVSPAPVLSTASTCGVANAFRAPPRTACRPPRSPRVTTTSGTCSTSRAIASSRSSAAATWSASCSFGTSTSSSRTSSSGSGCAGAGVRSTVVPASCATRADSTTTSSGDSSCSSRRSAPSIRRRSAAVSSSRLPLAPGTTTIRLAPLDSTTMCAVPVSRSTVRRSAVSTPAEAKAARRASPCASSPTTPTKLTDAPSSDAAIAWFAPLPPGPVRERVPITVSPRSGARSTKAAMSMLQLPTTTMRGVSTGPGLRPRGSA